MSENYQPEQGYYDANAVVEGRQYVDADDYNALAATLDVTKQALRDVNETVDGLKKSHTDAITRLSAATAQRINFERKVREAFRELVDDRELEKATANDVLRELEIDLLPSKYEAEVSVRFYVTFEAADPDDARSALEDLDLDASYFGSDLDDFEVDNSHVYDVELSEVDG